MKRRSFLALAVSSLGLAFLPKRADADCWLTPEETPAVTMRTFRSSAAIRAGGSRAARAGNTTKRQRKPTPAASSVASTSSITGIGRAAVEGDGGRGPGSRSATT